jgi:hypothetical protein
MDSLGTNLVNELVNETNVSESTTSHDLIVTSTSTISVVVFWSNALAVEIASSRRASGDLTSRRDMIGSDGITDIEEAVSILYAFNRLGLSFSLLEERRVVDISG